MCFGRSQCSGHCFAPEHERFMSVLVSAIGHGNVTYTLPAQKRAVEGMKCGIHDDRGGRLGFLNPNELHL